MAKSAKPKPWEGSKPDKAQDKREAKKRGISAKQFEGSAADRKLDAAAQKKRKKKKVKR